MPIMTVISVPARLRYAALTLFISVPLIAMEVIVANRASWWNLPYPSMGYWSLAFGLICVPIFFWLLAGKRWAYPLAVSLETFWILASAWQAIRMKYPPLGFFTLFLLAFFLITLLWLKSELEKSYFASQLPWYQGLPKPIPGLKCRLILKKMQLDVRVSRLDSEGAFVFSHSEVPPLLERQNLDLVFEFKEHQIKCHGVPRVSFDCGKGVGIQFFGINEDLKKEFGDFVEILRGEGYV